MSKDFIQGAVVGFFLSWLISKHIVNPHQKKISDVLPSGNRLSPFFKSDDSTVSGAVRRLNTTF